MPSGKTEDKKSRSERKGKERIRDDDKKERIKDKDDSRRRRDDRGEIASGSSEPDPRREKRRREGDKDRVKDRERGDKERTKDRDKERPRERDSEQDRTRDKDRGRHEKTDKGRNGEGDREKRKERSDRNQDYERKDRDRRHEKNGESSRIRSGDREKSDREKEREKERRRRRHEDEGSGDRRRERRDKDAHDPEDPKRREKDDKKKSRERSKGDEESSSSRERKDRGRKDDKKKSRDKDDQDKRKDREHIQHTKDSKLDEEDRIRRREKELLETLKQEEDTRSKSKSHESLRFRADTLEEAEAVEEEDTKQSSKPSITRVLSNAEEVQDEDPAGYDYDEDFEDYEEDFEDEPSDNEDSEHPSQDMQELLQAINAENEMLSREGSKLSKSSDDESKRETAARPVTAKGRINFVAAKQKQISQKVASKTRKRGQELMRLIDLDVSAFEMFDLPPMNEYELYIKNFGRSDTKQAYVQCNDDNVDRELQTEDIEIRTIWTQHPAEGLAGCGDEQESFTTEEFLSTKSSSHIDSVRMTSFLKKAGQACLVLLEEALVEQTSIMLKESKCLACTDGYVQLATKQPLLGGRSIRSVHISPVQTHLMLAALGPIEGPPSQQVSGNVAKRGLVCLWNINEPSEPQKVLVCESLPRCCCLSPSKATLAFAGLEDGSVVAWDLREPASLHHSYKIGDRDVVLRSPTFSTAGVLTQDAHHSPVVTLLPVVMPGDSVRASSGSSGILGSDDIVGLSFQLASLERDAMMNIWVVVEMETADVAGSESDLGLAPGGKIKLIQSASLPLEPPFREVRRLGGFQTSVMHFLPQDPNHFYIATDTGYVLHRYRHGGRSTPKAYQPTIECLVEISAMDVSPWQLPCILVGSKDGILRLYNIRNEFPLSTWSHFTRGIPILSVRWSRSRPGVFFVLDEDSGLYIWDLLENESGPAAVERFKHGRVTSFELSSDYAASGIGIPGRSPEMVLAYESGVIEVHRINSKFSECSPDEFDKFDAYLNASL
ncbi:cytoplasmic dynein 2 intermediate chain 1 isoform X2 [Nematostella vectensis]|uniref:cytoplasmic dynein 2 intermediate chain 1 isoform X2 n=1 Tax=Nematostella vectensis TaxID=45351 RepID=UPI0020771288|nr:cytoplasmic dynein 2 intermediate chain 1 isoform X2 [Nematostella vectensis]